MVSQLIGAENSVWIVSAKTPAVETKRRSESESGGQSASVLSGSTRDIPAKPGSPLLAKHLITIV
jgi:hypothetical protein